MEPHFDELERLPLQVEIPSPEAMGRAPGLGDDAWKALTLLGRTAGENAPRVDVALDDGQVVRTHVTAPPEDMLGDGELWLVWVRGIRGSVPLNRVRLPGGWDPR